MVKIVLPALSLLVPALSLAQYGPVETVKTAGPSVSLYYPIGSTLKNAFSSQILSFGFGPVDAVSSSQGRFRTGVNFITASDHGNKMLLIPLSGIYERDFNPNESSTHPYGRIGAGVTYYDYSFRSGLKKYSNKALGASGFAELGVNISGRLNIYGRYNVFDQKDGVNFNGWSVGISYGILKI
jgi:hypothetical protein